MITFSFLKRVLADGLTAGSARDQQLVQEVVEACAPRTWALVERRLPTLSRHEARGYIVARATLLVTDALSRKTNSNRIRPRVREAVMDQLVSRMHERAERARVAFVRRKRAA